MSERLIVPWHAYSLPEITMETLSAEAGLDAMALTYGAAYIQGCEAGWGVRDECAANKESNQSEEEEERG
ncbi:Hypothetical predicted protein [Xyrichtys novacula]|uniref:Uncharacterized protein n=1 Tax=Xyrichtys novacula TaxID=13765 RepID=A0AAV1GJM0_XYRNO|nr:Hypothetical predicted protein [Xyrichtys novacula]